MQGRTTMPPSLQGRAQQAKSQKHDRCQHLYGMRNEDLVRDCWRAIKQHAAYGVDRVSAQESAHNLEDNIRHLVERLKSKSSRAKLVRRHSRPKGGGQVRPLGMPVVEEKLVQLAVTRLLTAIDEQDFLRWSYGYRPHVGALDAVDTLTITLQCGRDNWGVEADITGFCDNIDHAWILRMLAERIDDRALLRLIKKWLKAGGLDTDGTVRHPATGSPQGGTVSPILANVSVPYALDLWFEKVVTRHGHGDACLIRYADDDVCAFEHREDAERFSTVLGQRLRKGGLELSGDTTRL
jgi:RNA-directed DNA polymerase